MNEYFRHRRDGIVQSLTVVDEVAASIEEQIAKLKGLADTDTDDDANPL